MATQPPAAASSRPEPADFQSLNQALAQRAGEPLPDDAADLARALASRWFTKAVVKPVTVDVVTSFAVQELVAVDGDALLSLCFDYSSSLTGATTKQLGSHPITLIFILEQVLARLRSAHLFFKIVWFQDRAAVSQAAASSSSSPCDAASRRSIRAAVRAHIDGLDVVQDTFDSIDSDKWRSWLDLERPYAIMTTDGSQEESGLRQARDTLALAQHLGGGLKGDSLAVSVVLMDKAMFQDHKIFAFLLEATPLVSYAVRLQSEHYQTLATKIAAEKSEAAASASPPSSSVADLTLAEKVALAASQNSQADESHRIALILAAVLIARIPLSQRALKLDATQVPTAAQHFLAAAYDVGAQLVASAGENASVDAIDPRLFAFLASNLDTVAASLPADVLTRTAELAKSVGISNVPSGGKADGNDATPAAADSAAKLLPYNPSAKLELPQLSTDPEAAAISEHTTFIPFVTAAIERAQLALSSTFSQYKRSSKDKVARDAHGRVINKLASRRFKADQRYANTITLYAQSLLGSAGLIRQVITEGVQPSASAIIADDKKQQQQAAGNNGKDSGKDKKAGKDAGKKLSKKEQIIAQNQARKSDKASASVERKLTYLLEELEIGAAVSKFDSADSDLLAERRRLLPALAPYIAGAASAEAARDLRLLKVRLALEGWVCACTIEKKEDAFDLAVTAFTEVGQILSITPASGFSTHERALLTSCGQALRVLGLQGVYGPAHAGLEAVWDEVEERKGKPTKKGEFPFDINWPRASKKYTVGDPIDFQLSHCGDVMERQLDSKADRRVATFKPDGWQRKVLDAVDARDSLLVVAPTSAGKTFIAFYVIEKALRESSDAVVVYVAPSKALVNQIAAELEARYSKNYGALERSIWSISTGEFDVHNPLKAQVLVADPSVLHKMCLSSDVAGSWLPRVKAVIVDEVHTLTDKEHGPTQQQLLALVPAPIIALSATVGNVAEFGDWMGKIRKRHGQNLSVIEHPTRYSDLKKHVFLPGTSSDGFKGVTRPLETKSMFRHLHPFSALRPLGASLPSDLEMTPAEQLQLVRKMQKYASPDAGYAISDDLDPQTFFGDIVGPLARSHTLKYQAALRQVTQTWMDQPNSRAPGSPFVKVIDSLEGGLESKLDQADASRVGGISHLDFHKDNILPLLSGLHQNSMLPAICFNFDRDVVETLGKHVIETLTSGEAHFKGTNKNWLAKVAEWNAWQDDEPARKKADEKRMKAIKGREEAEALKKDAQRSDAGWQASFDPEAPLPDYTFANEKCGLALEDVGPEANSLPNVDQWMKDGLIRGVAIHHSGMPLRYRQTVERWFRKGWLRVVISTGTLALGINMPAKTSVFVGDHVELNALQYRQAAGRAGRRGMDLAGNVFFYGIPMKKIQRLLTSRLPSLDCDFPSSATLNLRLHSLLAESSSKQMGEKMLQSVLGLQTPPSRWQELPFAHQFRASVEFLRRFGLMAQDGQPLALSGLAGHLATAEPANLAFLELLRSGCLYNITVQAETDRPAAVDEFVTVLSHLFASRAASPTSPFEGGKDVLPPLSEEPRKVLEKLAQQAKEAFVDYASAVASEQAVEPEVLPYSRKALGGKDSIPALSASQTPHSIRSSYLAASGLTDADFSGLSLSDDVLMTTRPSFRLTPGVLPDFGRLLDSVRSPRNSYILDFFKWGNLEAMTTVNGIPAGERWYVLRDFWQVLTSLRSCLELVLKTGAKAQAQGVTAANSGQQGGAAAAKAKKASNGGNGAAQDSWEFDPPELDTYQGYDDGEAIAEEDRIDAVSSAYEFKTDSGVAGSQMGGSGGAAKSLSGPAVHRAGQLRTRSGKVMDPIAPPMELPNELVHPQLYAVYKLLWDVMDRFYSFYVPTFA